VHHAGARESARSESPDFTGSMRLRFWNVTTENVVGMSDYFQCFVIPIHPLADELGVEQIGE